MTTENKDLLKYDVSKASNSKTSIKSLSTRGLMWTGLGWGASQFMNLVTVAVLARLLAPSLFGLISMAMIALDLIRLLADWGLTRAIIQRREIEERHLSTAFWMNFLLSVILASLGLLIAPVVATFFNEPLVQSVVMAMSLNFVLGSLGNVHLALLQKKMDFRVIAFSGIFTQLFYTGITIALSLTGLGVWALVIGSLARSFLSSIIFWAVCSWRPKFMFDYLGFKELFGFGANLMGAQIVLYLRDNIGSAIIGKTLDVSSLAYYNLALNLTMVPGARMAALLNQVLLPAFSAIQESNDDVRRGYLKTMRYISILFLPFSIGIIVTSPEIIRVIYGPKWLPTITLLQITALSGTLSVVPSITGGVLQAKGRPDIVLKMTVASLPFYLFLVSLGMRFGLVGMTWAYVINKLVFTLIGIVAVCKLIHLPFRDYFSAIWPSVLCAFVMGGAVTSWRAVASGLLAWNDPLVLISSIFLGIIVYLVALRVLGDQSVKEVMLLAVTSLWSHEQLQMKLSHLKSMNNPFGLLFSGLSFWLQYDTTEDKK